MFLFSFTKPLKNVDSNIGVFSQISDKNLTDKLDITVRNLILNRSNNILWRSMASSDNAYNKNALARRFINFTVASSKRSRWEKADSMVLANKVRRGWLWEHTIMANWGASAAQSKEILAGRSYGHAYRSAHVVRSFIGGGLNNVYRFNPPKQNPYNPPVRKPFNPYSTTTYKMFRLRFERWFFKHLGNRTYVWFANIWVSLTAQFNSKSLAKMYEQAMQYLAKKGTQFYVEATQAHIVFQSLFMAVTSITGLQFFMKNMSLLISSYRSHWSLIRHMMTLFYRCKNYFWFKTLYQYRLVMRGKFGGHMRARQEVLQHGVVKIHQWDLNINYYRIFPVTKYGVFSVRFWLQMRDMRILRLRKVTDEIQRQSRSEARLRFFGYTRKNYKR